MSDYTSNLRSHYKFEENGNDTQGNYNGTISGSPTYPSGVVDKCIQIDAAGIFESNYADLYVGTDNTIAFWLNYNNVDASMNIIDFALLPLWPQIELNTNSYIYAYYDDDNAGVSTSLQSSSTISGGVWNHIAVTTRHDSGDVYAKIYINGVGGSETNLGTYVGSTNLADFFLGYNSLNSYKVDEIRVYERALTASDVLALYNFELPSVGGNTTNFFFAS